VFVLGIGGFTGIATGCVGKSAVGTEDNESPEGLRGALTFIFAPPCAGDAGRLLNTLFTVGVIGVLDGLSICNGKFLKLVDGDGGGMSLLVLGCEDAMLPPVCSEFDEATRFLSSSSIEGKL